MIERRGVWSIKSALCLCALVALAGCDSPPPSTSNATSKSIAQPLRTEVANGLTDQYEQFSRCLALSEIALQAEIADAVEPEIEPEAVLRALKSASARTSELRKLALNPQFHPSNFALVGRERRVESNTKGYTQAYRSLIALSKGKAGGNDDLAALLNDDMKFCGGLLA